MKPETIAKLEYHLKTLSVESLEQFLALIIREIYSRGHQLDRPPKSPPRGEFKDCKPIRGA